MLQQECAEWGCQTSCTCHVQHDEAAVLARELSSLNTPPAVPNVRPEPPPKPGTAPNAGAAALAPKPGTEPEAPSAGAAELDPKAGALPEAPKAGPALEAPKVNPVEGAELPGAWDAAGPPNAKLGAEAAAGTGDSCQAEVLVTLLARGAIAMQHHASQP